MKLTSRCIPLGMLPYETIDSATRAMAKLFDKMPYIPVLPKIDSKDSIKRRTLQNIPGIVLNDSGNIILKPVGKSYEEALKRLDRAFNSPNKENLQEFGFDCVFLEKFLQIIKKFKSPNACVNLLGPFTISQILQSAADAQTIADKSYRKLFIQAVCVKALWIIDKIREYCPDTVPIIILEEPMLGKLGEIKRENEDVTVELVTNMFSKVIEKIKEYGAAVCVQSMEKCDWQVPINAGADMISFDAYNNPNNLNIIPETIIDFVSRGGKINWAIVPVISEAIVKSLNAEYLKKRFFATLDGLVMAGVPEKFVYNSALVSTQGDSSKLPLIFAEKAVILSTQLAKKIPFIS